MAQANTRENPGGQGESYVPDGLNPRICEEGAPYNEYFHGDWAPTGVQRSSVWPAEPKPMEEMGDDLDGDE